MKWQSKVLNSLLLLYLNDPAPPAFMIDLPWDVDTFVSVDPIVPPKIKLPVSLMTEIFLFSSGPDLWVDEILFKLNKATRGHAVDYSHLIGFCPKMERNRLY